MASRIGRLFSALALPALASTALAQNYNDIILANGGDAGMDGAINIVYGYSNPSVGFAPGTNPPDFAGDWVWRVLPREMLIHPLGTMENTGSTIGFFDTDWTTVAANFSYDIVMTPGMANPDPLQAGNIVPDNASALGVFIGGADLTTLPPPVGCPPAGSVDGYIVGLDLTGGGAGPGLVIQADGTVDWTYAAYLPGGMSSTAGTGACGNGDYLIQDTNSNDETQPDINGNGRSSYGGFSIAGAAVPFNSDAVNEVHTGTLEFQEPITEPRTEEGVGLRALHPPITTVPTNTLGMRQWYQLAAPGELGFWFGSILGGFFPAPGLPLFDIFIMVNIADPLAGEISAIWNGPFVVGGTFADDQICDTIQVSIPPPALGFTLNVQGFSLDPGTLDFDYTQCAMVTFFP